MIQRKAVTQVGVLLGMADSCRRLLLGTVGDCREFLEVTTPYTRWFDRMVAYGFENGRDFSSFLTESTGGRPSVGHAMKLDMAKEISMIQRTAKGKQARQ